LDPTTQLSDPTSAAAAAARSGAGRAVSTAAASIGDLLREKGGPDLRKGGVTELFGITGPPTSASPGAGAMQGATGG
jgi:hypothetical protein